MNVRLDVAVSAIARDSGLDPDRVSQDKQNLIGWINDVRREIYDLPQHLSTLDFTTEIVGSTVVTAGTVSATNGNAEVTGVGTSFATTMNGRMISIASGPWQRISYVTDTTHLSLESGWQATTTSTAPYKIWKRDYALPPKVSRITRIIDYSAPQRGPLTVYDPQEFYTRFGLGDTFTDPISYTQFMSSDRGDDYLSSTVYTGVTATANSPIVDFNGATLIGTLFPGDRIKIGDSTTSTAFAVEKVLTNTKIALKNYLGISSAALTATAMSVDRLMVQFYPSLDNTKLYMVEGVRQVHDLSNNGDFIEKGWYSAVIKGAKAKAFGYVRDPREAMAQQEYMAEVAKLIRNTMKATNPSHRLKPYIGTRYGQDSRVISDRDTNY